MNKKEFRGAIVEHLQGLAYENKITPETITSILAHLDTAIENQERYLVSTLSEKIQSWETAMGEDDKSLYTLGMRHAIDFIRGSEPQKASEYQPLDDDYRPK